MSDLAELARAIGADDLFVLHRVDKNRLVNLDGAGRGAGWAGNIDVDPAAEPWVSRAFDEGIVRIKSGVPSRICETLRANIEATLRSSCSPTRAD